MVYQGHKLTRGRVRTVVRLSAFEVDGTFLYPVNPEDYYLMHSFMSHPIRANFELNHCP
jgi:hypothetical protein